MRISRRAGVVAVLGVVIGCVAVDAAVAQDGPARRVRRRPPLRLEVVPPERLYRQCVDTHVIEHRPSGDTIVPRSRCWWAVR
jgi:hypothetical protein